METADPRSQGGQRNRSAHRDEGIIAGGIGPGVLLIEPDFPENKPNWPCLWG